LYIRRLLGCLFFAFCLGTSPACAEIYKDIRPLDTLADIKAKLPGATYERLHPAWAQEWDTLYSVSGQGLSGTIVVKFHDDRPSFRKKLQEGIDAEHKDVVEKLANASDEDALSVDWVRWIPVAPIPLPRFVSKYGKPDTSAFSDEDLQPYRVWKKGVTAFLADDEKSVVRVDYFFTRDELRQEYKSKYGLVPDFLSQEQEDKSAGRATAKVPKKAKRKSGG
jgi:hypothetical protein